MFHFAGGVGFGVDISDFLEFKGAFERDGIMDVSAEVEERIGAQEAASDCLNAVGLCENFLHVLRHHAEFVEELSSAIRCDGLFFRGEMDGEQDQ